MAESGPRYRSLVASAEGRPITGDSGLRLEVDSRQSGVTGRVETLLIAAGLSYLEVLRTRQSSSRLPARPITNASVSPSSRER
jgi:hypothetical protein